MQVVEPSTADLEPAAHGVHDVLPVPVLNEPALQSRQLIPPAVGIYFPARHAVQLADPDEEATLPAVHAVHDDALSTDVEPAKQSVQLAAPPRLYVPAKQLEQVVAATELAWVPGKQLAQKVAFAAE